MLNLWQEIICVIKVRNKSMHSARYIPEKETERVLSVAGEILEYIFPSIVHNLGLHLHEDFRICGDWKCKYESAQFCDAVKAKIGADGK